MTEPQHVSAYTAPMFTTCPKCGAKPMQPCTLSKPRANGGINTFELRYTHAERNR